MPRARTSEAKGVTIALVIFVLLSVLFGVMAYFGYAEQADLLARVTKVETDNKTMTTDRDRQRFLLAFYKLLAGHGEIDKDNILNDDSKIVSTRKTQFKKELDTEIDKVKQKLKDMAWNDAEDRPMLTHLDRIAKLEADVVRLKKSLEDAEKRARESDAARQAAEKKALDDKVDFEKKVDEKTEELKKVLAERSKAFEKAVADAKAAEERLEALTREFEEFKAKAAKEREQLVKEKKDLEAKAQKLEANIGKIDLLDYDQPKGKILSVDRDGTMAYIDLGSADNVKPKLTFSIFGSAPGKPGSVRKGALEVVQVLGQHLSLARITDNYNLDLGSLRAAMELLKKHGGVDPKAADRVIENLENVQVNQRRTPIISGDLLYNAAWSPTLREHVAIAGLIDLTGDGLDNSDVLKRDLEAQGIIVDAYLDPRDGTVHGPGISRQTNYLILGETIHPSRMKELVDQATELGVTQVTARRFLALIGYRLPRRGSLPGGVTVAAPQPAATGGGAPAKPPAAKPPAEGGAAPNNKEMMPNEAPKPPAMEK
ncbi:MAG: hypothetical protein NZ700_12020 [Gemmataceae bacterium]|nr:hypothetical protein [Gemmataceae bacterium]MDW8263785.1 hypothetical protein [Gemmataceae bacterium]